MFIDEQKCIGCAKCIPYCPVQAHYFKRSKAGRTVVAIDQDKCAECGLCLRMANCYYNAIYQVELDYPREIRALLSDPTIEFKGSNIPGRGTAEIKTNEITGRVKWGQVGLALEMGRPGISTKWSEVEKMTKALAAIGAEFCQENPVTFFMKDQKTGELPDELKEERSISAIIEFDCSMEDLPKVLQTIKETAKTIDTVFSFPIGVKLLPGGKVPEEFVKMVTEAGFVMSINSKNNMGFGRPRFNEEGEQ